ncbi:MAG: hypothetical protein ACLUDD_04945 [Lactobacillus kalixensis]|uniref:hypothetical protein n=1 Tax=Lactobacillus kalixensis TaxID=227944 RepID=UPI0039917812
MARQLDLFAQSRTTSYRNTHRSVTRRLQGTGSGAARVDRAVNRLSGQQSMRANQSRLRTAAANFRAASHAVIFNHLRRAGNAVRATTGHSGG